MPIINGKACVANGRNLIIQSDLKPGYLDRGNGSVHIWGPNFYSDNYIATNGATVFTFSSPDYVFKGSSNHTLAMYDSDKKYLGYQSITSETQTLDLFNVAYIRFSINFSEEGSTTGNLSDWLSNHRYKLEKGSVATPWTPAPVDKVFSDGRQVYGRNYNQNSDNYLTGAGKQLEHVADISGDTLQKLRGKQVTISVDVDYTNARHEVGEKCRIGIEFTVTYESGQLQYLAAWKPTTAGESYSGRVSQTMVFKDEPIISTSAEVWAYAQDVFDESSVGRPKLEIGTTFTPWSPAPEDVI